MRAFRFIRRSTWLVTAVIASACVSDRPTGLVDDESLTEAERVARAVAVAMADPEVRGDIRDVMRGSLYVGHQIELREFLRSDAGQRALLRASAVQGGLPGNFLREVDQLPELVMFVPSRDHRLQWTATPNLVVGVTLENDNPPTHVFTTNGEKLGYNDRRAGDAMFLIEPIEQRDLRIRPQIASVGRTIQDPGDGELGGVYARYDHRGRLVEEFQLADLYSGKYRSPMADSMLFTGPADTTHSDYFWTDAYDGAGTMEIEQRAKFYNTFGQVIAEDKLRKTGVSHEFAYYWHEKVIHRRIMDSTSEKINLRIVETDAFSDDDMGNRDLFWGDRGQTRSYQGSGDNTNVALGWTRKAYVAPPPAPPYVSGSSYIAPYEPYTWNSNGVSGGSSPYSYEWYLDGNLVDTGTNLTTSISEPSSWHTLQFYAYDQNGLMALSAVFEVNVSAGCPPPEITCFGGAVKTSDPKRTARPRRP